MSTDTTPAPTPTPDASSLTLHFYGAHRESPFTPRKAIIIDEVESDSGVPATDKDPGRGPRRIVNALVFNSAKHDGGRPEVEQVKHVLLLAPAETLKEGEETPWEWPAVNFVSVGAPVVVPRSEVPPKADDTTPAERRSRRKPADQTQA